MRQIAFRLLLVFCTGLVWRLAAQEAERALPEDEAPAPAESQASRLQSRLPASSFERGKLVEIRPFIGVDGTYQTGLSGVSVDEGGRARNLDSFGASAEFGVQGYHAWKRTLLGVDYAGAYRYYRDRDYGGLDNTLQLSLEHEFGRRWALQLGQSAASTRQNVIGGWGGVQDFAPAGLQDLSGNELFNDRTTALTSTARLAYSPNRMTFGFGGTGFLVRRDSTALVGSQGFRATGDVSRRLGKNQTIGGDYSFTHFGFTGMFGSTDAHGVALSFTQRLGKRWRLRLRAGAFRVETSALTRVSIDPLVAAIIGQSYGIETSHRIHYAPDGAISLSREMRRGSFSLNYARGINPGNGVSLASASETASASYARSGTGRLSFGFLADASRFRTLMQTMGDYFAYGAGANIGCALGRGFAFTMGVNGRRYEISGSNFHRLAMGASMGIRYTPEAFSF